MRFIVDENAGPSVAGWLRAEGHIVVLSFCVCATNELS